VPTTLANAHQTSTGIPARMNAATSPCLNHNVLLARTRGAPKIKTSTASTVRKPIFEYFISLFDLTLIFFTKASPLTVPVLQTRTTITARTMAGAAPGALPTRTPPQNAVRCTRRSNALTSSSGVATNSSVSVLSRCSGATAKRSVNGNPCRNHLAQFFRAHFVERAKRTGALMVSVS
jgi:hypothetical protein